MAALEGCRLAAPTEINEVFAIVPTGLAQTLKAAGAIFAEWPKDTAEADVAPGDGEVMMRLVASFATTDDHVEQFLEAAQRVEAA